MSIPDEIGASFEELDWNLVDEDLLKLEDAINSVTSLSYNNLVRVQFIFDSFVARYPGLRDMADGRLWDLFRYYDPEFQREINWWVIEKGLMPVKKEGSNSFERTLSWRDGLHLFMKEMNSKIHAQKKRYPPKIMVAPPEIQFSDPTKQRAYGEACTAAFKIAQRKVCKVEERGACSHCVHEGHGWKTCPDLYDCTKGVAWLVQPDYYKFTGLEVPPMLASLHKPPRAKRAKMKASKQSTHSDFVEVR